MISNKGARTPICSGALQPTPDTSYIALTYLGSIHQTQPRDQRVFGKSPPVYDRASYTYHKPKTQL